MADTRQRPLKILQVASHNKIQAGGAVQMMRLALGLKRLGHDVTCAFNIERGDDPPGFGTYQSLVDAGIPIHSFPMQHIQKYLGRRRFRKFLEKNRFDVVHTHRPRALEFVCRATKGMQIPVLLGNRKNSFSVPTDEARWYGDEQVDAIIVNARMIIDLLVKTGRVQRDKVVIIYNGVELERFRPDVDGRPIRQEFGIAGDVPLFGMVANFARKKDHGVFFEAALQVLQKHPQARFLLVGKGDTKRYEKMAADAGFGDRFVFAGYRTDIPEVVAALDCSVISSRMGEGLTGSLVEAMAMAKPVVSTDVGGNADFVHDRETGMLVPTADAAKLAEAMCYIVEQPEAAAEMGRKGYEFVCDKVNNNLRTQRFLDVYIDILHRKGFRE